MKAETRAAFSIASLSSDIQSMATLEGASALTRCANDAAATGLTMLKLFQAPTREAESIRKAEEPKVRRIELVPMQAHPVVASNTGT